MVHRDVINYFVTCRHEGSPGGFNSLSNRRVGRNDTIICQNAKDQLFWEPPACFGEFGPPFYEQVLMFDNPGLVFEHDSAKQVEVAGRGCQRPDTSDDIVHAIVRAE